MRRNKRCWYQASAFGRWSRVGWLVSTLLFLLTACRYCPPSLEDGSLSVHAKDSLAYLYRYHYTWNTNLELLVDSVYLECLPVKDSYTVLYKGDRVVVAEFAIDPHDPVDSVWVKLAHTQNKQGWMRESEMKEAFVPMDSISEFIYVFSRKHVSYSVLFLVLFVGVWLLRTFYKKPFLMVYFADIDSLYPLSACLLMAISATVYETIQVFAPETWEHFYYNPTLSPFQVPFILSLFLMSIWLFVIVLLAVLDDLFRQLSPLAALFYLLGLFSSCIFCYFFFILTTHYYLGYLFLGAFIYLFVCRLYVSATRYRCGACKATLRKKGVCPYCGAVNQ